MSQTVFKTVQMYCQNPALPEVVERSGYVDEQKAFVLDVLRNRTSIRAAGEKVGLGKHTALKIFMDICNTLDPIEFPKDNPRGMLEPRLDAALKTGKAREILRRNVVLTVEALAARLRSFGAPGVLAFSGCGQDSCDDIMAAAAALKVYPVSEPAPETPSLFGSLDGVDDVLQPTVVGMDFASNPDITTRFVIRRRRLISKDLAEAKRRLEDTPIPVLKNGPGGTIIDSDGRVICTLNLDALTLTEAFTLSALFIAAAEAVDTLAEVDGGLWLDGQGSNLRQPG